MVYVSCDRKTTRDLNMLEKFAEKFGFSAGRCAEKFGFSAGRCGVASLCADVAAALTKSLPDDSFAPRPAITRPALADFARVLYRPISCTGSNMGALNSCGEHTLQGVITGGGAPRADAANGCWSSDGSKVAIAGEDVTLVFDAAGTEIARLQHDGAKHGPRCLAWGPDDTELAVSYGCQLFVGKPGSAMESIWNTSDKKDSGAGMQRIRNRSDPSDIWCLAWNSDGNKLATGLENGTAHIFDAASGRRTARIVHNAQHSDKSGSWGEFTIRCLEFSPDGKKLATGGNDRTARVSDVASGADIAQAGKTGSIRGTFDDSVTALTWSPDSTKLAIGAGSSVYGGGPLPGGNTRIVNANNGRDVALAKYAGRSDAVSWSPDGMTLAIGSTKDLFLLDAFTGEKIAQVRIDGMFHVDALAWSPDSRKLAAARGSGVSIIDTFDGEKLYKYNHFRPVNSLRWLDDQNLASVSRDSAYKVALREAKV